MPEGPEVHRAADRLNVVLEGERVEKVAFAFPRLRRWQRALRGRAIARVEPRGKAFLIRFGHGPVIYAHQQLYGTWVVLGPRARPPKTERSLRLELRTARGRALLYSASEIDVLPDEAAVAGHPYLEKLGPDVLVRGLTARAIRQRLQHPTWRNRRLGGLFLDQEFLAGLGNYLRSEILFVAGVHPDARPRDLDPVALERLARATLTLTRRSYRTGGITNDPERAATLQREGVPRRAYRWQVFRRGGRPCWVCDATIEQLVVAGRRLDRCPDCQPEPERAGATRRA